MGHVKLFDLYIGSYTERHDFFPNAKGEGILSFSFDAESGRMEPQQRISTILNPSYLGWDSSEKYLLVSSENMEAEGSIHLLCRTPQGGLEALSSQPSGGLATCHIGTGRGGKVYASSYLDGVLTQYSLDGDQMSSIEAIFRYTGKSVNQTRQECAHAHQAVESPDHRWLYVCDLGSDRLWRHSLGTGKISPPFENSTEVPAGYGPRHMIFHPRLPVLYVLCELNAHLLTYEMNLVDGTLTLSQDQATLPEGWGGEPSAAAIRLHPSGKSLYISNRNHHSLSAYQFDEQGKVHFVSQISSGGETPRDFGIDPTGRYLVAAHQDSNNLATHELDRLTGFPKGESPRLITVPTPVCVLFSSGLKILKKS